MDEYLNVQKGEVRSKRRIKKEYERRDGLERVNGK